METRSRVVLKRALDPWMVTDWHAHDYGIDAMVEIVADADDGVGGTATSKRFAVQLKATNKDDDGIRVPLSKIHYWLASTERVLLVVCRFPSEQLVCRWVDDALIDELTRRAPSWYTQETVTIPLGDRTIGRKVLAEIAIEVNRPRTLRRVLAPGTYVHLHGNAIRLVEAMVVLAREAGASSVVSRLTELQEKFRTAIYVVAITGPSRAGKSTLLNALVGKSVAPVGRLPTTAVTTLVTAAADEHMVIEFEGGHRERGPIDPDVVARYVTQDRNPDNAARVTLVHLFIAHAFLERGLAIADAPGLHDPSPEIRAVTDSALRMAHAILYVLDVSPHKQGGFSVTRHMIDDLKRLHAAGRLIVVLNKVDVLTEDERDEVRSFVEREFNKYEVQLSVPPQLVSARGAADWRTERTDTRYPLGALEEAVWGHLLAQNATGISRLQHATIELRRGGADFATLLHVRCAEGTQAAALRSTIESLRSASGDLRRRCEARAIDDRHFASAWVTLRRSEILQGTRTWLEGVRLDKALPDPAALREYVAEQVASMFLDVWQELRARFDQFAHSIREDAERVLRRGRADAVPMEGMQFISPGIAALVAPPTLDLPEAWLGLLSGGFLGLMLGGPWAWLLAGAGWLAGVVIGREGRRSRDVNRVCKQVEARLDLAGSHLLPQIEEKITLFRRSLLTEIDQRIDGLALDLEHELPRLGTPLTADEAWRLEALGTRLADVITAIDALATELANASGNPGTVH